MPPGDNSNRDLDDRLLLLRSSISVKHFNKNTFFSNSFLLSPPAPSPPYLPPVRLIDPHRTVRAQNEKQQQHSTNQLT